MFGDIGTFYIFIMMMVDICQNSENDALKWVNFIVPELCIPQETWRKI